MALPLQCCILQALFIISQTSHGIATLPLDTCMQVADALQQPFTDAFFDLIWSLESGEHMPDKQRFVGELVRVCAPGGRIIIVTWCHRCAI